MKLQTQVPLKKANRPMDYNSRPVLFGSCFSQHIGAKLRYFKFRSFENPFGILFHPLAIENVIFRALKNQGYTPAELFFGNDQWHCFDAHSALSDVSREKLLERLDQQLRETEQRLLGASHLIITLGTAWTYEHIEQGKTVANCHKVPQKEFRKSLLSVAEIRDSLQRMVHQVKTVNPAVQFIFTISPVRHLKDGFVENQRSKSHLIAAVQEVLHAPSFNAGGAYFPAYEIMMDELRDYRFYDTDMLHPNTLAISYIWERFKSVWIADHALGVMERVDQVQRGLGHRPFNAGSARHQEFQAVLATKIRALKEDFPFMVFE
ncbi:GSCFA domain-containing protein [Maribacter sp. 2307ULW6-5]|uniref:GSCFA domain-containing protein n=1 Tax=Maribacter sp. 2307ULW6-5 TaxID=3386275 RepID=UPI0039BD5B5B